MNQVFLQIYTLPKHKILHWPNIQSMKKHCASLAIVFHQILSKWKDSIFLSNFNFNMGQILYILSLVFVFFGHISQNSGHERLVPPIPVCLLRGNKLILQK